MPSTFTNNLGIQKPANGEQSGTWGGTVNANSDIIDIGVNGILTLTLSGATSTLTTSDGVVSNGQYKMLSLSGSPTAGHTVTISPNDAQKIYQVYNATSVSVVFTQGSGGNYTVAAGESVIITANGAGAGAAVSRFDLTALRTSTVVASTSGTSILFSGIPAATKRIVVMFSGVSTTTTSNLLIRLGTSATVDTTGYVSTVSRGTTGVTTSTAGLIFETPILATDTFSGAVTITKITGNTYVSTGNICDQGTNAVRTSAGTKSLSGVLTHLSVTTVGGSATFDAGNINIMYET